MNYRHIFHAGNFADVFKHWVLCLILEKLLEKPAPFTVIDTHAGLGLYELESENAQKTMEYISGVKLFLDNCQDPLFTSYKDIVKDYYSNQIYPGSPKIIQHFLRVEDRLILSELHPEDYLRLKANFSGDRQVKVFNQDAYQTIKAVLPPLQKRGLVFIDPPFEKTNEFAQIISGLQEGIKRFAHGIYLIWYPIKDRHQVKKFYRQIQALEIKESLCVEIHSPQAISNQLAGCGLIVLNPPWQLREKLSEGLPKLLDCLQIEKGKYIVQNL